MLCKAHQSHFTRFLRASAFWARGSVLSGQEGARPPVLGMLAASGEGCSLGQGQYLCRRCASRSSES